MGPTRNSTPLKSWTSAWCATASRWRQSSATRSGITVSSTEFFNMGRLKKIANLDFINVWKKWATQTIHFFYCHYPTIFVKVANEVGSIVTVFLFPLFCFVFPFWSSFSCDNMRTFAIIYCKWKKNNYINETSLTKPNQRHAFTEHIM